MRLGILREQAPDERRVAIVPDSVPRLTRVGLAVSVEPDAGLGAGFSDDAYRQAGAEIADRATVLGAEVVVGVGGTGTWGSDPAPTSGAVHLALFDPRWDPEVAPGLARAGVSALSLDLVPRITRAQTMDVLSSMATVAGYEAVLVAAARLPRLFPMLMTAAGTLTPARVLVIGAGVAGLQAIATARRLGAVVEGYDIRPAAMEQILSLGARAVTPDNEGPDRDGPDANGVEAGTEEAGTEEAGTEGAGTEGAGGYARAQSAEAQADQRALLARHVAEADVVITTAAVPGQRAPVLITADMIEAMGPGSVVVDLAAERGGNTDVTRPDEEVAVGPAVVVGPTDLASRAATHASQMFSANVTALIEHLLATGPGPGPAAGDGPASIGPDQILDRDDEIVAAMLITHQGAVVHPDLTPTPAGQGDT